MAGEGRELGRGAQRIPERGQIASTRSEVPFFSGRGAGGAQADNAKVAINWSDARAARRRSRFETPAAPLPPSGVTGYAKAIANRLPLPTRISCQTHSRRHEG